MTENFLPLRLTTVKPQTSLTFDLYIYFKEHYVKYYERGKSIDKHKYQKLKNQNIANFYISQKDEENYIDYLQRLLQVYSDEKKSEDKINVIQGVAQTALERLQAFELNESSFKLTQNAAKNLSRLIFEDQNSLREILINKIGEDYEVIINHSINVCLMCSRMAQKLKLSESETEDLAIAALMHDVGIIQNKENQKLFRLKRDELTTEQKKLFFSHCKDSVNHLLDRPFVTQNIQDLIIHHEETLAGEGPYKLLKLTDSQEALSLCNRFDKVYRENPDLKTEQILKQFKVSQMGNYRLEMIDLLNEALKEEGFV